MTKILFFLVQKNSCDDWEITQLVEEIELISSNTGVCVCVSVCVNEIELILFVCVCEGDRTNSLRMLYTEEEVSVVDSNLYKHRGGHHTPTKTRCRRRSHASHTLH